MIKGRNGRRQAAAGLVLVAGFTWSAAVVKAQELPPETLVPPALREPEQQPVEAGNEVFLSASGGYLQYADGSSDRSLRAFTLWFDGQPAGDLECMDDVCGGTALVPANAAAGAHSVSVEGGSRVALTVTAAPAPEPPLPPPPLAAAAPFQGQAKPLAEIIGSLPRPTRSSAINEADVVAFAGAAPDALPYVFVTAAGTGSQFKLGSWEVADGPEPLGASAPMPGFDVKLHKPNLASRVLVSAARRADGNLWLTSWRLENNGSFTKLLSRGYGDNAGVTVARYAIGGRRLSNSAYQIVTPVVGSDGVVRLVTWQIDAQGSIAARQDSGPVQNGLTAATDAAIGVAWQRDGEYAVNFRNAGGLLSWQYWSVNAAGVPAALGESASPLGIRGTLASAQPVIDLAALPLTSAGQTTALLSVPQQGANLSPLQLISWEHNRALDPLRYGAPYRIAADFQDQQPGAGVAVTQPAPAAARYLVADTLFESVAGEGQGTLLGALPAGQKPAAGIGSVVKVMSAHQVLRAVGSGAISLDDCVTLDPGEFGGLANGQSYSFTNGRVGKIVNGQTVPLAPGDRVSLRSLLRMSLMVSDKFGTLAAAHYAARALYDPNDSFASLVGTSTSQGQWTLDMQARAEQLGLSDTRYCDAAGRGHSTPQDQVSLWMAASQDPVFTQLTSTLSFGAAEAAAEFAQCGTQLATFGKGGAAVASYPGYRGSKDGVYQNNLDVDYVGDELQCNQPRVPQGACLSCLANQAERLERTLVVAQSQSPSGAVRDADARNLLDYGYQKIFTPDRLADSGTQGSAVGDFALASLDPVLNVSAAIVDGPRLELCLWNVAESGVQRGPCHLGVVGGLQAGVAAPANAISMIDVTATGADAAYLTGYREDGKLRLDYWRVGPTPE